MKFTCKLLIISLLISLLISCNDKTVNTIPNLNNTPTETFDFSTDWSNFQYKIDTDGHVEKIMNDLCSDEYLGRVVGTKENEKTQEYIKEYFEKLQEKKAAEKKETKKKEQSKQIEVRKTTVQANS